MKAKEIHDLLLSLLLRGVGIWVLYGALDNVYSLMQDVLAVTRLPHGIPEGSWRDVAVDCLYLLLKLALAGYFLLGAPPFLKWATRDRPPR